MTHKGVEEDEVRLLMVPRPPTRRMPNRANGTETVTTLGVMFRMTATSAGFEGMSLDDMARPRLCCCCFSPRKNAAPSDRLPKVRNSLVLLDLRVFE